MSPEEKKHIPPTKIDDEHSRKEQSHDSGIAWEQERILGVMFALIGISGFLYGWEKGFALGGLTWLIVFVLISLYSCLVLRRER